MLKAVFFDLDGTLLPLDEEKFIHIYFKLLCEKLEPLGYDKEELTKVIWSLTKKMYSNDGSMTNEKLFWDNFLKYYGQDKISDRSILDSFYLNEFKQVKSSCEENKFAVEIVKHCKEKGLLVILSTNPFFPRQATLTRMNFVGLLEEHFDYITTYENSSYCKPNPKYFLELLNKFNLKPDEVILFGNNTLEDGECSYMCNIKCYMVGDYIINDKNTTHEFEHIQMNEVIEIIDKEITKI